MKKILLAATIATLFTGCAHTTAQKRAKAHPPWHLETSIFMCRYLNDLQELQAVAGNDKLFEARLKTSQCRHAGAGRGFALLNVIGTYVKVSVETETGAADGWTTSSMIAPSL